MPEYQFADKGGKIVSVEYDKNSYFSADQVLESLGIALADNIRRRIVIKN